MWETAIGTPFLVFLSIVFGIGLAVTMFQLDSFVSHPKKKERQPMIGGLEEGGAPIFPGTGSKLFA